MKKLLFLCVLAGSLSLTGCNPQAETAASVTETPAAAKDAATAPPTDNTAVVTPADTVSGTTRTAAYECPMKCEGSASDKPGQCPVCGMDLVKST